MDHGLQTILDKARRDAMRMGHSLTTAHALLAMLRVDGDASRWMQQRGVREDALIKLLKAGCEEPRSALELALERVRLRLAQAGEWTMRPVHLLEVLAEDSRTAAYRCLHDAGLRRPPENRVAQPFKTPTRTARSQAALWHQQERLMREHTAKSAVLRNATPTRLPLSAEAKKSAGSTGSAESTGSMGAERTTVATSRGGARPPKRRASQKLEQQECGAPVLPPGVASPPSDRQADRQAGAPEEWRLEGTQPAGSRFIQFAVEPLGATEYPMLSAYGRDLTALAYRGCLDPVFGRDQEIEQLLEVVSRRRASHPLLIGPPGSGKTAIVEALAGHLLHDAQLRERVSPKVIEIGPGALVSGTGVRGALLDRMRRIFAELEQANGMIWLFIDEIHSLPRLAEGADDVVSELKSALARATFRCVGATTDAEFRRYMERDSALVRRFTRVDIDPPSPELATQIVLQLAPRYAAHHQVQYDGDACRLMVDIAVRYVKDSNLPDSAIAMMDLAGARAARADKRHVGVAEVADAVADRVGVPAERLLMRDHEKILSLEDFINDQVRGQRVAIAQVGKTLRKAAAGFRGKRPLASFLFVGPTGVGKTQTAKAIASCLFGHTSWTRLDMTEYSEPHTVARLVGSPPGYVGHEEGGQLTELVRRKPYQLVLLDEIEKAHPDVLLTLLPLLDEGRLTDSRGRTVDFTNTVVVMTSNLGVISAQKKVRVGFGHDDDMRSDAADREHDVLAEVRRRLPPELWNRIDEVVYFRGLDSHDVHALATPMLDEVARVLKSTHDVTVTMDASVVDLLMELGGFDPDLGARPMRRAIARWVEEPLATAVLTGALKRGDCARVAADFQQRCVVLQPTT
jgi:ATP-dependent Clp protease ATP-binding subunit ClpC